MFLCFIVLLQTNEANFGSSQFHEVKTNLFRKRNAQFKITKTDYFSKRNAQFKKLETRYFRKRNAQFHENKMSVTYILYYIYPTSHNISYVIFIKLKIEQIFK